MEPPHRELRYIGNLLSISGKKYLVTQLGNKHILWQGSNVLFICRVGIYFNFNVLSLFILNTAG